MVPFSVVARKPKADVAISFLTDLLYETGDCFGLRPRNDMYIRYSSTFPVRAVWQARRAGFRLRPDTGQARSHAPQNQWPSGGAVHRQIARRPAPLQATH